MHIINHYFRGAGMSIRDQIREACPIGQERTYADIELATGMEKAAVHSAISTMVLSGEFESVERGLLKRVKKVPGPLAEVSAVIVLALSDTEPRGTAELSKKTGFSRKRVTASLHRLKRLGMVASVGKPAGNGTARFILTGSKAIPKNAARNDVEFVMPDNLPDWLTMPVIVKPGRVVTFWSAGE